MRREAKLSHDQRASLLRGKVRCRREPAPIVPYLSGVGHDRGGRAYPITLASIAVCPDRRFGAPPGRAGLARLLAARESCDALLRDAMWRAAVLRRVPG